MNPEVVKLLIIIVGIICSMISFSVIASDECESGTKNDPLDGQDYTFYPSLQFTVGFGVLIFIVLIFEAVMALMSIKEEWKAKLPEMLHLDSLSNKWVIRIIAFFAYTAAVACSSVNTYLVAEHDDDAFNTKYCSKNHCKNFCEKVAAGATFMWFTFFCLLALTVYSDIEIWRQCCNDSAGSQAMANQEDAPPPTYANDGMATAKPIDDPQSQI